MTDQRQRIVEALSAESSPLRDQGVSLMVDRILDTPIAELIDLREVSSVVLEALTVANLETIIQRHVVPGWERYDAHARDAEHAIGSFVPDDARANIVSMVVAGRGPKGKWLKGAIDPILLGRLLAPVYQHLLMSFAMKLPIIGGGQQSVGEGGKGKGGLAGRLTRGVQKRAEKLVDASVNVARSVSGGLGVEMERRLQETVKEFSEGATKLWSKALRDRLRSDEGRKLVEKITNQVTSHVFETKIPDFHDDVQRLPISDILATAPSVIAHGATHEMVRAIVEHEIEAFLELEGTRSSRELLAELGVLDQVLASTRRQVDGFARSVFESEAFAEWLDALLEV